MVELPELPPGYRIKITKHSQSYVDVKLQVPFLMFFNRSVQSTISAPGNIPWTVNYLLRNEKNRLADLKKVKAARGVYHGS